MKNKIEDLRNHLFAQIEALSDESLTGDELKDVLWKANAIRDLGQVIVSSAKVEVDFIRATGMGQDEATPFLRPDKTIKLKEKN